MWSDLAAQDAGWKPALPARRLALPRIGRLTRETGFELIPSMAAAEDKGWEYTLGRIDERTENLEKRLDRVEADVRCEKYSEEA